MRKNVSLARFALWYVLVGLSAALASETVVLDFERPATGLQFPGVAFQYVDVIKGEVRSSPGVILRTAPSGSMAAFGGGAKITFTIPVIKVSMLVSRSFITVPLKRVNSFQTARLNAFDAQGQLLATATAPVIAAVAEQEFLENFSPTPISVAAAVPIAQVTIDLGEPFSSVGSMFFIDDVTLTIQEQQPLVRPTLSIERLSDRVISVRSSIPNAEFQQSPSLVAPVWQPVQTGHGYIHVDTWTTRTNAVMFFRAVR